MPGEKALSSREIPHDGLQFQHETSLGFTGHPHHHHNPAGPFGSPHDGAKPWLGYFLGYRDKGASFGISSEGNTLFEPLKRDATPIAVTNPIHVKFDIIETLPDGKTVRKKIDDDAFTSDSPASLDPKEAITIRGKVTGSSSLKNPLQLPICMDFLPHKYSVSTDSKEQLKAFQKKPSAMRSISNSATVTTSISSSSTR